MLNNFSATPPASRLADAWQSCCTIVNNERGRDGVRDKHKTGRCAMGREGCGKKRETRGGIR